MIFDRYTDKYSLHLISRNQEAYAECCYMHPPMKNLIAISLIIILLTVDAAGADAKLQRLGDFNKDIYNLIDKCLILMVIRSQTVDLGQQLFSPKE